MITLTINPTRRELRKRAAQLAGLAAMLPEVGTGDENFSSVATQYLGLPVPPATELITGTTLSTVPPPPPQPAGGEAGDWTDQAGAAGGQTDQAPPPTVETNEKGEPVGPWDGRYHASTKTKTGDGHWKMKRGLNDTEKAAAMALRAAVAPPAAPPATPPAAGLLDFPSVVKAITGAINTATLQPDQVNAILTTLGITGGIPGLATATPEVLQEVVTALGLSV